MVDYYFDANEVEPASDFEPIPAGDYIAQIVSSEKKEGNSGAYLKLEFEILGPKFLNRKVWTNLNLWIDEDTDGRKKAKQIAQGHMSAICRAVGRMQIRATEELHNKPMAVKVTIRPAKDGYQAQNEIKGFKSVSGMPSEPALVSQPAPSATGKAPWATS